MKKLHFFFLFFLVVDSYSHEFNPAHLVVNQLDKIKDNYEATWMYPVKNIGKRAEVIFSLVLTYIVLKLRLVFVIEFRDGCLSVSMHKNVTLHPCSKSASRT